MLVGVCVGESVRVCVCVAFSFELCQSRSSSLLRSGVGNDTLEWLCCGKTKRDNPFRVVTMKKNGNLQVAHGAFLAIAMIIITTAIL